MKNEVSDGKTRLLNCSTPPQMKPKPTSTQMTTAVRTHSPTPWGRLNPVLGLLGVVSLTKHLPLRKGAG